tara:strand:- start:27 stop:722 length:696 start_codon:yes stop_codon:yes gene_type:complete
MAEFGINIDTVYQTVQALANKEQRGYVTPQEFNLFANQAQLDIFEQYFYDLNAFVQQRPESNEIGDSVSILRQKLKPWTYVANVNGAIPANARPGRIWTGSGNTMQIPVEISPNEWQDLNASRWHKQGNSTESFYWREPTNGSQQQIHVRGGQGNIEYIEGRPKLVYWGYVIVNEKPMYDPSQSAHFTLHASEQPDIIIKILELAGISIEDAQLLQYASSEEQQNIADERI